mmetsp:Transcript_18576/g.70504  ORF Transcript_18576/g.70504 Transcript_18576/m.70504 type:complete len:300 (-) Transcript_18576:747-1646(-)
MVLAMKRRAASGKRALSGSEGGPRSPCRQASNSKKTASARSSGAAVARRPSSDAVEATSSVASATSAAGLAGWGAATRASSAAPGSSPAPASSSMAPTSSSLDSGDAARSPMPVARGVGSSPWPPLVALVESASSSVSASFNSEASRSLAVARAASSLIGQLRMRRLARVRSAESKVDSSEVWSNRLRSCEARETSPSCTAIACRATRMRVCISSTVVSHATPACSTLMRVPASVFAFTCSMVVSHASWSDMDMWVLASRGNTGTPMVETRSSINATGRVKSRLAPVALPPTRARRSLT